MTPTPADVSTAAWQAWAADLSVVPPREDGTKAPASDWKQYQSSLPEITRITQWYGNNGAGQGNSQRHGIGLVCGRVSGGLEMLELEGAAVAAGLQTRFREICDDAGLKEVLDRIVNGCVIQSPSGGFHMLYKVPTPKGNTKLARRVDRDTGEIQVLVETRGEGGYVVTAPSHGPVHPSGDPWLFSVGDFTTIATITDEERDALWSCARVLDDMPAPRPTTAPQAPSDTPRPGDTYNKAPGVHAATMGLLTGHGWTVVGTRGDNTLLRRPGKNLGISATLRDDGTFYCFTTSTVFDAPAAHSPFHVKAVLEHGGDHRSAAQALTPPRDPIKPATVLHAPPDNSLLLPDDFWAARHELAWVRQAAHARIVSADAVLHSVLARVAAHTPSSYALPPTVASAAGLSYVTALVGPPGSGKSGAWGVACDLLDITNAPDIQDNIPVGSGEGLVEILFDTIPDPDNERQRIKAQKWHNACVFIDEGQALTELGGRQNSTLLTTLRTIWIGGTIGQANAARETRRIVQGGTYVYGIAVALQPAKCGPLLADAGGGTPQRLVWASATDPKTGVGEWPGQLPWSPPRLSGIVGATHTYLSIHADITQEVRAHHLARARGETVDEELDAHRHLVQLKVAALLAMLNDRTDLNPEDWQLAATVVDTSDSIRGWAQTLVAADIEARDRTAAKRQADRQIIVDSRTEAHLVVATAEGIRDKVEARPGRTRKDLRNSTGKRQRAYFDAAAEHAIEQGWIVERGETVAGGTTREFYPA